MPETALSPGLGRQGLRGQTQVMSGPGMQALAPPTTSFLPALRMHSEVRAPGRHLSAQGTQKSKESPRTLCAHVVGRRLGYLLPHRGHLEEGREPPEGAWASVRRKKGDKPELTPPGLSH